MSIAEQKVELVKLIVDADEESTSKLLGLAQQLTQDRQRFSIDEITFFEKRADDFIASGAKGYSAEESLALLKKRM